MIDANSYTDGSCEFYAGWFCMVNLHLRREAVPAVMLSGAKHLPETVSPRAAPGV